MKLLLDEQVPARLSRSFPERFDVRTVQQMGWAGVQNGALLQLAARHGFDALVSADKNMEYQQSPSELAIAVIVLTTRDNRLAALQTLMPSVIELLDGEPASGFYRVDA